MKNLFSTRAGAARRMMAALSSAIVSRLDPTDEAESCWLDAVFVATVVLMVGGIADAVAAAVQ